MCLRIRRDGPRRARTATKSIRVFKALDVIRSDSKGRRYRESPVREFRYHDKSTYSAEMQSCMPRDHSINLGLHAYTKLGQCAAGWQAPIIEAFIPKGARYWFGDCEDIVSNRLQIRSLDAVAYVSECDGGIRKVSRKKKVKK